MDPDIEVKEDLGLLARGTDPQLMRAIKEVQDEVVKKRFIVPKIPPYKKKIIT